MKVQCYMALPMSFSGTVYYKVRYGVHNIGKPSLTLSTTVLTDYLLYYHTMEYVIMCNVPVLCCHTHARHHTTLTLTHTHLHTQDVCLCVSVYVCVCVPHT